MPATATPRKKKSGSAKQPRTDVYKLVTDRILAALDKGIVPWHRPWKTIADGDSTTAPRSLSTRKPYRGINVFLLGATALVENYSSPWWGTYRQIDELGGHVRKGEHGTPIVFWRFIEKKDAAGAVTDRIPFLRYFTVFNADQCDDLTTPEVVVDNVLAEHDTIADCEQLSERYRVAGGPKLRHGGNRASYAPLFDTVSMPQLGQFEDAESYYSTLFHEYVHSTGHESRLKRPSLVEPAPFGSEDYSREELVAEMGAAFICGSVGIDVNYPQSAAYIASWKSNLEDDPKLLVQSAGAAQRAADLILGVTADETPDKED